MTGGACRDILEREEGRILEDNGTGLICRRRELIGEEQKPAGMDRSVGGAES